MAGAYPVRFLSVLTEAFDKIIEARYPGLVEARLVPCACQDEAGGTCRHAFTLEELMAEATADEPDADHKVRCPKSRRKIEAALMLDGLRGTGLTAQLDAIHRTLDAQTGTLSAIDARQQAELNGIRALLETRANAGVHCPALFSIRQTKGGLLHQAQVTVTLWCEWPSGPHPLEGDDGSYTITKMPDALIRYLPYLRHLITALGLAAPALGSVGVALSDQVKDQVEAAARTLEFIDKHTEHRRARPRTRHAVPVRAHGPRRDRRGLPRPARHAPRPRPGQREELGPAVSRHPPRRPPHHLPMPAPHPRLRLPLHGRLDRHDT